MSRKFWERMEGKVLTAEFYECSERVSVEDLYQEFKARMKREEEIGAGMSGVCDWCCETRADSELQNETNAGDAICDDCAAGG